MQLETRKRLTVLLPVFMLAAMGALVYYAVPLYQLFCQITGYGGTTQASLEAPGEVSGREITVSFDANVNPELPWRFRPAQRAVTLKVGEERLAFYEAENTSEQLVVGSATFNVTPAKAGQYFVKMDCFCFTEQSLRPGQRVDMPVTFYIDPAILDDPSLDDVEDITLSYTFFRNEEAEDRLTQSDKPAATGQQAQTLEGEQDR